MSDDSKPKLKLEQLRCRRTGLMYSLAEHRVCPYCSDAKKLESGASYDEFCDFDAEHDPVNFGFPPGASRFTHG